MKTGKTYTINFNTGAGNVKNIKTLGKAMEIADEEAAYTQCDIDIYEVSEYDSRKIVATRQWNGVAPSEEDEECDIISYGNFGFYGEWIIF